MNNKGFTLIEVLITVILISISGIIVIKYIGNTLSISKNEAYKIMKNNIVSSAYDYLNECNNELISCDLKWYNNTTTFSVVELKNAGFFPNLKSPIDNKNLANCMNLKATKENGNFNISIIDNCY